MKIGVVCPYDIFRGGGVQEHVMAQAAELRRRGHSVKIITPRPLRAPKTPPKDVIYMGSSAAVKTSIGTSIEVGAAFAPDGIEAMLDAQDFDVLHIHEPEVPMLGSQILVKATCPVVATFHALHPDTAMAKTIGAFRARNAKTILTKLAGITAVSEVAAAFIRQHTNKPIEIIPNGIDLKKYKPPATAPNTDHQTIVYVGRLEKRKGVQCLLEAYAKLTKDDKTVVLQIVGDGPDRDKLKAAVKQKKIPRVHFAGFVDEATKIRLISEADIFCSPALYGESFGIVLLEAMALGAVVVAGNNPGYKAVMQDVGAISLVDPKDTTAFTAKLQLLLTDESLRQKWQDWAKQYIKQFDYPIVVDSYEALYKRILKG